MDESKLISEQKSLNEATQLELASNRLESTLWFGLNERLPESLELLSKVVEFKFADIMT